MALPMTVRLIQEFLEGASAKSTLQRYFPASEPDMSWIRRSAERTVRKVKHKPGRLEWFDLSITFKISS